MHWGSRHLGIIPVILLFASGFFFLNMRLLFQPNLQPSRLSSFQLSSSYGFESGLSSKDWLLSLLLRLKAISIKIHKIDEISFPPPVSEQPRIGIFFWLIFVRKRAHTHTRDILSVEFPKKKFAERPISSWRALSAFDQINTSVCYHNLLVTIHYSSLACSSYGLSFFLAYSRVWRVLSLTELSVHRLAWSPSLGIVIHPSHGPLGFFSV